jgi:hypothetical protein
VASFIVTLRPVLRGDYKGWEADERPES